jgi:succinate dehydrogenase / fumarate reductase cytochrome b subunit
MSQLALSAPPGDRVPKTFPDRSKKRPFLLEFLDSPVALKWIMALSGVAGIGFVFMHMVGNLHLYEGPEEVNNYAEALRTLGGALAPRGGVLWLLRFGLIAAVAIHIYAAARLTIVNHQARPQKYESKRDYIAADLASRTMRYSGVWLTLFIVYHLADLTWGMGLTRSKFIHGDPYNNVAWSFSSTVTVIFYILSMVALAFHLFHGAWSLFQSLGINSPRWNGLRRGFAISLALIIFVGNVSFPVMVSLGVISQDTRCWPTPEQIHEAEAASGISVDDELLAQAIDDGEVCPFRQGSASIVEVTP